MFGSAGCFGPDAVRSEKLMERYSDRRVMQYSTARCSEFYVFKEKHIPVIHCTDIKVDPASVQLTQMIKYFKAHQKMWSWVSKQPLPRNETIAQGSVASPAL